MQDLRNVQTIRFRQTEQFVVRHAAPKKISQPRSQFDIADAMRRGGTCRIAFHAKEKVRIHQNSLERDPDSALERISARLRHADEAHQFVEFVFTHRPAISPVRQRSDDAAGTIQGMLAADEKCAG